MRMACMRTPFKRIVAGLTLVSKMRCADRDPAGQTGTGGLNILMIIAPPFGSKGYYIIYHVIISGGGTTLIECEVMPR